MVWSLLRARRRERTQRRQRYQPACEVLEDRTVPDAATFTADFNTARSNQAMLDSFLAHGSNDQLTTTMAAQVAQGDVAVEQHLSQDAAELQYQVSVSLATQLGTLFQQEMQLLSQENQQIQAIAQV